MTCILWNQPWFLPSLPPQPQAHSPSLASLFGMSVFPSRSRFLNIGTLAYIYYWLILFVVSTLGFEIIVNSRVFVRNNTEWSHVPVIQFPQHGNTLQHYSIMSCSEHWNWCRKDTERSISTRIPHVEFLCSHPLSSDLTPAWTLGSN